MAENNVNELEQSVVVLEKEITCAICHCHHTHPKVLPCSHCYCKECISSLAQRAEDGKPFLCPECRAETTLPDGGVDGLQTGYFVNRMKEVHSKLEKVRSNRVSYPGAETCTVHHEPKIIYCYICSDVICRDCAITTCHDHKREFIRVAAPEMKEELVRRLNPLKSEQDDLSHAMEKVQIAMSDIKDQGQCLSEEIDSFFKRQLQTIERRNQQLLAEVKAEVTQKLNRLSAQEKNLSEARESIQSVVDYAEQCINNAVEEEFVHSYAEVMSRVDKEMHDQQDTERQLEPVEEVDLGVELTCEEDLKQLCEEKSNVARLSLDPSRCSVVMGGVDGAEVNKMAEVQVIPRLSNGKPTRQACVVECCLRSLSNTSVTSAQRCDIIAPTTKENVYRVRFTPTNHGPNELMVRVNGCEVAGSPISMFVSIHPTQLGKPVSSMVGFDNPRDIAVSNEGMMVVTEPKHLVLLDETGLILKRISASAYSLSDLFCVDIDRADGSIYVTGNSNIDHKIIKLDVDFKQVAEVSSREKLHHRGVTVTENEVLVCERDRCVIAYTKDLKTRVRQIGSGPGQFGTIRDVAVDVRGNVYVTDYDRCRVEVFDSDGGLLRLLPCDGNGANKLKGPRGVCVAGRYVYVTNWHCHSVVVFTIDGEYVTSFGRKGNGLGELKNPWGVCVNKDGILYVCAQKHNRVHKYLCTC